MCLICKQTIKVHGLGSGATPKTDRACVDHCHSTNKIRGMLCNDCNKGLGAFKDNIQSLINAAEYLKQHQ